MRRKQINNLILENLALFVFSFEEEKEAARKKSTARKRKLQARSTIFVCLFNFC